VAQGGAVVGLRVTLLGGFEARLASGSDLSLPTKKARALLAYLSVHNAQSHPRDKLAALLWGEKSDQQARGSLRHALVTLRRALGPPFLTIEGHTVALNPRGVEVDVRSFEQRVAEGTPRALELAAELYRGDLLLGFTVNEPLFEEWLVAERERLREMALEALARLLAEQTKGAGTERAIQTAVRLLALDPLQEAVHRTLMRLYARQGRRGAALKQYQACVGVLQRELGTEPEAETRALYQELLRRATQGPETVPLQEDRRSGLLPQTGPPPSELPAAETPLFGRQAELGRLRESLDEALRGHGRVVTVLGEAGIGKTRLLSALVADALGQDCRVLIGHCHESDSILPFGPWVDACRTSMVSTDEEILDTLHPARRAELARLFPEAGRAGLPRASDSALPLFESLADLIKQLSARQPLVLVLEDLHWADEMTLRLLAFVSRRIPAWSALLVVTAREEELADASLARRTLQDLSRTGRAQPVVLPPLSRSDTAQLVRALTRLGSDVQTVARLEEQIWTMSEGNPFVAVEAMRAVNQDSRREDGRDGGVPLEMPASIRDLVARRLDQLGARTQELAAVAAVIGRRFDFTLLQSASGLAEREAAAAVEEMVRHHVLQAVVNELDFAHDRIRDVAYRRLLPSRRRLLLRLVAEALEAAAAGGASTLEAHRPDHLGEQIEQMAHHALRGDMPEKAVRYLRQAGARAAASSALRDARAWYEQALSAIQALPETPSTLADAFDIRLALRTVMVQLGEFRRVVALLREAETIAGRLNDDARRGRVSAFMTNIHARLGEPDKAIESGAQALGIADRLGDSRLRILATSYVAQAHYYCGEYAHVVELLTGNIAAMPADSVHDFFGTSQLLSVNDRCRLLMGLAHLGRFRAAAEYEAEAIQTAESTHHAYTIGLAYHAAGMLHLVKGDWDIARPLLERQLEVLLAANIVDLLPYAFAYSARALAHLGTVGEALHRLQEAERLLDAQSPRGRVSEYGPVYLSLGRASLLLGRLDEAQRLGDLALGSASGRRDFVPYALLLLGDLAIHPDRFDAEKGEAHYLEARALAEPRGMRPLVSHCHLGLGKLYARSDRPSTAREHLGTSIRMYHEMDMCPWLEEAEAESQNLEAHRDLRLPGTTPDVVSNGSQAGPKATT
jgi:DNA-binding SARP family transcriptional activator